MKGFGFALISAGILALIYGGIVYGRQQATLIRPISVFATEQKLSAIAGGVALMSGVALLMARRRRFTPAPAGSSSRGRGPRR